MLYKAGWHCDIVLTQPSTLMLTHTCLKMTFARQMQIFPPPWCFKTTLSPFPPLLYKCLPTRMTWENEKLCSNTCSDNIALNAKAYPNKSNALQEQDRNIMSQHCEAWNTQAAQRASTSFRQIPYPSSGQKHGRNTPSESLCQWQQKEVVY